MSRPVIDLSLAGYHTPGGLHPRGMVRIGCSQALFDDDVAVPSVLSMKIPAGATVVIAIASGNVTGVTGATNYVETPVTTDFRRVSALGLTLKGGVATLAWSGSNGTFLPASQIAGAFFVAPAGDGFATGNLTITLSDGPDTDDEGGELLIFGRPVA